MSCAPSAAFDWPALRAAYQRDGVVCIRSAFDPAWVARVHAGLREVFQEPGPLSYVERAEDGAHSYVSDQFSWVMQPALRAFVFESQAARFAAELMGARRINLFYDNCFLRPTGSRRKTDWHNDAGYWPAAGDQLCTMWIPTQPTSPEDGGLEYVAGSQRWAQVYKDHAFHVHHEPLLAQRDLRGAFVRKTPNIEAHRDAFDIRSFSLQVGDCLMHHPLVLHASPAGSSRRERFAYSLVFAGEETRYAPRPDTQRMLHDCGLEPGAPLACELFPTLWQAQP